MFFWPTMEMMVWGFLAQYLAGSAPTALTQLPFTLLTGLIFWDILYRSQQAISISFMEDIWTQNVLNILISPLRLWEWHAATFLYGMAKAVATTAVLAVLGYLFYHYHLMGLLGLYLAPLALQLFLFGWAVGIGTAGILLRWGHAVEALIWGIPFLIQPLSAVFYPLAALPAWLQPIAQCLPSTWVCEAMRQFIASGTLPTHYVWIALALNGVHLVLGSLAFSVLFNNAREKGRLGRVGLD
jgi:ABC-2 type transport system permease protein